MVQITEISLDKKNGDHRHKYYKNNVIKGGGQV